MSVSLFLNCCCCWCRLVNSQKQCVCLWRQQRPPVELPQSHFQAAAAAAAFQPPVQSGWLCVTTFTSYLLVVVVTTWQLHTHTHHTQADRFVKSVKKYGWYYWKEIIKKMKKRKKFFRKFEKLHSKNGNVMLQTIFFRVLIFLLLPHFKHFLFYRYIFLLYQKKTARTFSGMCRTHRDTPYPLLSITLTLTKNLYLFRRRVCTVPQYCCTAVSQYNSQKWKPWQRREERKRADRFVCLCTAANCSEKRQSPYKKTCETTETI